MNVRRSALANTIIKLPPEIKAKISPSVAFFPNPALFLGFPRNPIIASHLQCFEENMKRRRNAYVAAFRRRSKLESRAKTTHLSGKNTAA